MNKFHSLFRKEINYLLILITLGSIIWFLIACGMDWQIAVSGILFASTSSAIMLRYITRMD